MAGALANRYASALVDVVSRTPVPGPEKTAAELAAFLAAFHASLDLRNVLLSPAVAPDKKKAVILALGARIGLSGTTANFLRVVTDHRRLGLLDEMLAAFQALLDERHGILRADVASAQPVQEDLQSALAAGLSRVTGKQVRPRFTVDPALLGGVVARIGSTIYDGSVRGRLHVLGRRLAAE
jgi:F-type H+-transporting ATPase subunit delta